MNYVFKFKVQQKWPAASGCPDID